MQGSAWSRNHTDAPTPGSRRSISKAFHSASRRATASGVVEPAAAPAERGVLVVDVVGVQVDQEVVDEVVDGAEVVLRRVVQPGPILGLPVDARAVVVVGRDRGRWQQPVVAVAERVGHDSGPTCQEEPAAAGAGVGAVAAMAA